MKDDLKSVVKNVLEKFYKICKRYGRQLIISNYEFQLIRSK